MSLASAFLPLFATASLALQDAPEHKIRHVAIVVYPGVELLDFAGPGEVFSATHWPNSHAFEVFTVAESRAPLKSQVFLSITPEYTLEDCPKPDVVVIPGGAAPFESLPLRKWVQARAKDTEIMMSVCNGALVYGAAGLLDGLEATTHRSAQQHLALISPSTKVFTNRRFVDNGRVVTAAGVSAGIDGALYVVSRLCGDEIAWNTARYMEYDWRPDELAKLHAQPGQLVDGADAMRWVSAVRKQGLDATLAEYRKTADAPGESDLNRWGYTLMRSGKLDEGTDVLRLAAVAFPASANAADSLSEALESKADKDGALKYAKECLVRLEKDKGDEARNKILRNAAASRVERLTGGASKLRYVCPPCDGECDKVAYLEGGRCPGCVMQLVERAQ